MTRTTEPLSAADATLAREAYSPPRLDDLGSLADLTQGGGGPDADTMDGFINSTEPT